MKRFRHWFLQILSATCLFGASEKFYQALSLGLCIHMCMAQLCVCVCTALCVCTHMHVLGDLICKSNEPDHGFWGFFYIIFLTWLTIVPSLIWSKSCRAERQIFSVTTTAAVGDICRCWMSPIRVSLLLKVEMPIGLDCSFKKHIYGLDCSCSAKSFTGL